MSRNERGEWQVRLQDDWSPIWSASLHEDVEIKLDRFFQTQR
jgi:hypothetical protein